MRSAIVVTVLLGALAASAVLALWIWRELGEVAIGTHGLIAIGLGAVLTFGLGAGLMALMFFSERRGYDDRARESDRSHADHWRQPGDED